MYQNYVVEIKKFHNGEFEHNIYWQYDEDANIARQKSEAKFHEVLSAAPISNTESHSAIMFSQEGFPLRNECYRHGAVEQQEI